MNKPSDPRSRRGLTRRAALSQTAAAAATLPALALPAQGAGEQDAELVALMDRYVALHRKWRRAAALAEYVFEPKAPADGLDGELFTLREEIMAAPAEGIADVGVKLMMILDTEDEKLRKRRLAGLLSEISHRGRIVRSPNMEPLDGADLRVPRGGGRLVRQPSSWLPRATSVRLAGMP